MNYCWKINIQTQQPDGTFQGTFTGAAGGVVNGKITGDVVTFHRTGYTCCEDCLQKGQKDQSWEGCFVGTTRTAIEGHWTGCRQEQFPNRDFRLSIY